MSDEQEKRDFLWYILKICIETNMVSMSYLQRKSMNGYNTVLHAVEFWEKEGAISAADKDKKRSILWTKETFAEKYREEFGYDPFTHEGKRIKVGFISLGCDKNRVDSERMLFRLKQAGFETTEDETEAEVIVINTCAFIESAKKEAIETILETAELKETGKLQKLIVTGCFAQRYPDVDFAEVDRFVPIADEERIAAIIAEETGVKYVECGKEGRVLTTPGHYAYLKIADGCNNRCAYCAIPSIRGKYRSEPMEKLAEEAKTLQESGVRELVLVAQDTTFYGVDLYGKPCLKELLAKLLALGFWKIRLLYAYPERIDDELIDFMAKNDGICRYIDMPLQHVNGDVLKKMHRPADENRIKTLITKLRKKMPDITVRSTFIAGFPTETEENHRELLAFIREGWCDYAGFFPFSPEEGTKAETMKPRVSKRVAKKWAKELEIAQSQATVAAQQKKVGTVTEVLYEGIDYDRRMFFGRTEHEAPDVDTNVYFTADFPLEIGRIYKVYIEKADFHLYGVAKE